MKIEQEALTFDDVLLTPCYSNVLPKDVSLKTNLTRKIELNIPLVSAAMDTVTEARLAIALAELGGLGILHKSMTLENQALEVRKVKKFESGVVLDPITVTPDTTVQEIMNIRREYNISGMPVVDGDVLVGIVTNRDIRFAEDLSQTAASLMTPKDRLITVKEDVSRDESIALFRENRVEKLLIVDDAHRLKGMITVKDIMRSKHNPQACRNESGQLRVAAAVGIGPDTMDRVDALVAAGVDLIVVDTAHGHSEGVLQTVRNVRAAHKDCQLVAGNIVTADAAEALITAGVDAIKVGVGPGSICTTRIIAGVGVPQISAIANVAAIANKQHIPVIADGGIRFSGDVSKALAAGASVVMIGGLFAGTEEAPGEVVLYQGRSYKSYRGMGSLGAMAQKHGSSDRYFQDNDQSEQKYVPEGIEGRVPYKGPLSGVVHQLTGGLRSSMGYTGSATIKEHSEKARFVKITNAGSKESHVHDVTITKEAPNYSVEK